MATDLQPHHLRYKENEKMNWKLNPIPILVTCIFSRFGQMTCLLLLHLIILFNLILILVLQHPTEMPSERKPNSLGIFKK